MDVVKGYDVVGNIAILKFGREVKAREKKYLAEEFLARQKAVTTVLEKVGKFSGRLRTQKTKWLAGEKTREARYKENGCVFRLNVDSCYFSPRLSTDRLEVASMVAKGERVLVMFGGVAPYAVVIAKHSSASEVVSVELGREPSKYARENVMLNKLEGRVWVVQGDVRRRVPELVGGGSVIGGSSSLLMRTALRPLPGRPPQLDSTKKFDRIMMARPNLKDSFLDVAFGVLKKGGVIHYHGFCHESEVDEMKEQIRDEAKKAGRKVRFLGVKRVGAGIGVKRYRYRFDFKVS